VKVCVTGGTGFLGAHLVRELIEAGHEVRVTYREAGRLERLGGLVFEPVKADVLDEDAMVDAMRGCDLLFHVAGYVGARPASRVWDANALAPRIVVQAAGRAGVPRVVHTSSVAAVGPSEPHGVPVGEDEPYHSSELHLTYADAKHAGEGEATAAGMRAGVDVVVVNPAYVLGAPVNRRQRGETSTRIVGNYLRGHLPLVMDGGASICDVRDVAQGHLLAAELGKPGERYILAGHNIYWYELVDRVREISGARQPLAVIPHEAARVLRAPEAFGLSGFIVDSEAYGLMGARWWASSDKAMRELGYRFRPLDETLTETIEWYRELIAGGAFADAGASRLSVVADVFHAADRLGMTRAMRLAEKRFGRRLVAGD
jgi:dihydroflavonol-4-reductase